MPALGRKPQSDIDNKLIKFMEAFINESETAKSKRNQLNRENYEMYHGIQDMSHKMKGQSKEFLPRQSMGVEHVAQFLHQGLLDFGDYFSANAQPGVVEKEGTVFTANQVRELLKWQLKKAGWYNHSLDAIKAGILGSLTISKVSGEMKSKRKFITESKDKKERLLKSTDKVWQLRLDIPRQRNMHIDPDNKNLCIIEEIEIDAWELELLAKDFPDMFDKKLVKNVIDKAGTGQTGDSRLRVDKEAETNQSDTFRSHRKTITLWEHWGNILNPDNGKLLFEQKTVIIADEKYVISKPRSLPTWDQTDPYVIAALIRTPNSVWHKALADFPTQLNKAINEVVNLLIDSGIQAAFGLKQIREHLLEDPSEIEDGIYPGLTIGITAATPPNTKVIERLDTGSGGGAQEAMNVMNILSSEHGNAMMLPDTRQGTLPSRATKATEIVATENASQSVFGGVAKSFESDYVEKVLEKAFNLLLQNIKKVDQKELEGILGKDEYKRISKFSEKQIFAKTYGAFNFKVFGLTQTLNKIKDFRKLTGLLQAISTNPELMEAFVRKYSFTKLLGELMKGLDINEDRIKLSKVDRQLNSLEGQEESPGAPAPANQFNTESTQQAQPAAGSGPEQEAGGEMFSEVASFARG